MATRARRRGRSQDKEPEAEDDADDVPCAICGDKESFPDDMIVFCEGCDLAVHQSCYMLKAVPAGDWHCRLCVTTKSKKAPDGVTCELCLKPRGALMPCEENAKWVHRFCCTALPECFDRRGSAPDTPRESKRSLEQTLVCGVPVAVRKRRSLRCTVCGDGRGACLQCCHGNCTIAAHPMCAREDKRWTAHADCVNVFYCPRHNPDPSLRPKIKKKKKKKKRPGQLDPMEARDPVYLPRGRQRYEGMDGHLSSTESSGSSDDEQDGPDCATDDDRPVLISRRFSPSASRGRPRCLALDNAAALAAEHTQTVVKKQMQPVCEKVVKFLDQYEGEGGTMCCAVMHGYATSYGHDDIAALLRQALSQAGHHVAILEPTRARTTRSALHTITSQLVQDGGDQDDQRRQRRWEAELDLAPLLVLGDWLVQGEEGHSEAGAGPRAGRVATVVVERVEALTEAVLNDTINALFQKHSCGRGRINLVLGLASHPDTIKNMVGPRQSQLLHAKLFPLPPAGGGLHDLLERLVVDSQLPVELSHGTVQMLKFLFERLQMSLNALPLGPLLHQHFLGGGRLLPAALAVTDSGTGAQGEATEADCVDLCSALPDSHVSEAQQLPSVVAELAGAGKGQGRGLQCTRKQMGQWMFGLLVQRRVRRLGLRMMDTCLREGSIRWTTTDLLLRTLVQDRGTLRQTLRQTIHNCTQLWGAPQFIKVMKQWVELLNGDHDEAVRAIKLDRVARKVDEMMERLESRTSDAKAVARTAEGARPGNPRMGKKRKRREQLIPQGGNDQRQHLEEARRMMDEVVYEMVEPLHQLPMHEALVCNDPNALERCVAPLTLQHIIDNALAKSHSPGAAVPDAVAGYEGIRESSRLINLADWLIDFCQNQSDSTTDKDIPRHLFDRFFQLVRNYEVLGILRPTSKRPDHIGKEDAY